MIKKAIRIVLNVLCGASMLGAVLLAVLTVVSLVQGGDKAPLSLIFFGVPSLFCFLFSALIAGIFWLIKRFS